MPLFAHSPPRGVLLWTLRWAGILATGHAWYPHPIPRGTCSQLSKLVVVPHLLPWWATTQALPQVHTGRLSLNIVTPAGSDNAGGRVTYRDVRTGGGPALRTRRYFPHHPAYTRTAADLTTALLDAVFRRCRTPHQFPTTTYSHGRWGPSSRTWLERAAAAHPPAVGLPPDVPGDHGGTACPPRVNGGRRFTFTQYLPHTRWVADTPTGVVGFTWTVSRACRVVSDDCCQPPDLFTPTLR